MAQAGIDEGLDAVSEFTCKEKIDGSAVAVEARWFCEQHGLNCGGGEGGFGVIHAIADIVIVVLEIRHNESRILSNPADQLLPV